MYFILSYQTVDGFIEKRQPHRAEHLEKVQAAVARGEMLLGGAITDQEGGAMMIFQTDDPLTVESFARQDPYVLSGLVSNWMIRPWAVVVGTKMD
ncbi:MAG: YciI-like protein [Bacteroidota bacterium]